MTAIGNMRHRVAIQTQAKATAASGNTGAPVFTTETTVWGSLRATRQRSQFGTVVEDAPATTHVITIRRGPTLTVDRMLVVDGTRRFQINGIRETSDPARFVEIDCAEERAA